MKRWIFALTALLAVQPTFAAGDSISNRVPGSRVPDKQWMQYVDPADAGFDATKLAAAEAQWKELPSSAFMVIADGAVVANWGDTERRFMCHSVRKSFLSALFGIYWDRREIELNKTMADVGIDEAGDGLLESEKQARILDLLKARSGVFHPAAYAGRTDSRPRGSEGPGRYFAYNNWDFNTLAAVLEKETGNTVFEAFDEHFGKPLAMEDWRVSDGYFHYERDKSVYPAYPFRMSARDAARFGLLFAREGMWGDQRILSRHWVRRSTALYSDDSDNFGYGFMWWVARQSPFVDHGLVSALGVGNQMIAALPNSDLVIVNRANTYQGERTPIEGLLELIESVLAARTNEPVANPELKPLESTPAEPLPRMPKAQADPLKKELVGDWPYPPAPLDQPEFTRVKITLENDELVAFSDVSGTFVEVLQPDGSLIEEDSQERYLLIRNDDGTFAGISDVMTVAQGAVLKAAANDRAGAKNLLGLLDNEDSRLTAIAKVLVDLFDSPRKGEKAARKLLESVPARDVERGISRAGFRFLRLERPEISQEIFALGTRLFPESSQAWEQLGEAHRRQGGVTSADHKALAIEAFAKALELDADNQRAADKLKELRSEADTDDD